MSLSKAVFQWIVPSNPEAQTLCVDPLVTSEKWMKCNSRWSLDKKKTCSLYWDTQSLCKMWRDLFTEKRLKINALESPTGVFP